MEWQRRFLHDELWLRSRRVVLARLRDLGLDSDAAEYEAFADDQQRAGCRLAADLGGWIGAERAAEIGSERFLGAGNRRFSVRLPFILAFLAEYAGWLSDLAPAGAGRRSEVGSLSALFNLGIVLVDQIGDGPDGREALSTLFGGGRLERLSAGAPTANGEGPALPTPELRVLAAIVSAFFAGVARLPDGGPRREVRARLMDTIRTAQAAQLAVAGGARDTGALHAKSVTPFVVPAALVALAADEAPALDLLQLGETIGEVFWRVDDLVDVARDHVRAEGNLVLNRAGGATLMEKGGLQALLEHDHVDAVARELASHARAAMDALVPYPAVHARACRWMELYIIDWMR